MYIGHDRHVVLSDLELIKKAFQNPIFQGRPRVEIFEFDGVSHGITLTTGQEWQDQRRFTLRHLRDFGFGKNSMEGLVLEEVDELLGWLKSQGNNPVCLNTKFNLAVVNSLWRIITGSRFSQSDPKLQGIFDKLFTATHPNSSFHSSMGDISLSALALDLFQAGSLTTSTTLAWAVLYLILHLDVQKKLQKEIDDVIGQSRQSYMADKPRMTYTEALTCEVLRKSSLLPFGAFHAATEDTSFEGYDMPKGTLIRADPSKPMPSMNEPVPVFGLLEAPEFFVTLKSRRD
ncbi:unnamed protein product [Allacma fusca]|uniref:Cytochrome P450 n=2 Tax=Allacma fusca TaxID=39272 RepID=A0A8J2NX58_9HEXA|nr:unnamed protein product [Allacma fusca]